MRGASKLCSEAMVTVMLRGKTRLQGARRGRKEEIAKGEERGRRNKGVVSTIPLIQSMRIINRTNIQSGLGDFALRRLDAAAAKSQDVQITA